jgi:fido (protein-threonine AMPylation protein)
MMTYLGQLRSTSAVGYASPTLYRVFLPCGEIIEALQYVISLLILPSLASSSSPRNVSRSALHVHPLLLSYYIFASLVFYIHPFCDGNGRLARLVANLVAKKEGYAMPLTASTDKTVQLDAFLRTALHRLVHCENLRRREHKTKTRSSAEQSTSTWF